MSMATAPYLFPTPSAATYPPPFPIFPPPPPPPPGFPYAAPLSYPPPPPGFFPTPPFDNRLAPTTPPPPASYSTPTAPAYDPAAHLFCANSPEVVQPHHHIHEHFPPPPVHLPVQGLQETSATHADLSYSKADEVSTFLAFDGSTHHFLPEPSPALDLEKSKKSAEAKARAEATINKDVSRAVLDLKRRLDEQQARDRNSFDSLQGELANLMSMAAQLAVSLGKEPISAHGSKLEQSQHISVVPAAPAHVAPKVFDTMPTPSSWLGTHGSASDYCSGHHNQIQSSCVSNLIEQHLDGMPQSYGFHNLNCQSIFLADGSEHNYFALPENYPLERAVPEPVFDVYADDTEDCSSKSVDVFAGTPGQQIYEEEPQEGEPLLKCLSKALETENTSACVNIISDVRDFTLELQQQSDEKTCNYPVLKASGSAVTSSNQLSIDHGMRELRQLWDPGASACLPTSMNNDNNDTIGVFKEAVLDRPPTKPPERYGSADYSQVNVQLRDPHLNVFVIHERRKEWDPGASLTLMLGKTQHSNQASQPATHATILAGSSVTRFSECKCLPFWVHNNISMLITESCPLWCLWEFSVSCTTLRLQFGVPIDVPQYSCYYRGPSSQENYGIQFLWDPGILSLMHMMLGKTVVPNQVHSRQTPCTLLIRLGQPIDLNQFWAQLLQCHSWCHTLNDFLQVQYGFLPIVLDCPYSEPTLQLVCYSSMISSTNAFHSANSMSTATAVRMILALSSGKIAEEDKDAAAVYQIFEIRLPTSKSSIIWDPKDTVPISCCNMPTSTCSSALRFVDLLLHREKVQWDPEIGTPSSIYLWMQGLTARMATKKNLCLCYKLQNHQHGSVK